LNVSIANVGSATLVVSGTVATPFAVVARFPLVIAPGTSAAMVVSFRAPKAGRDRGKLTLTTNDPTAPRIGVSLSARATRK
jgi:hypothetical protein